MSITSVAEMRATYNDNRWGITVDSGDCHHIAGNRWANEFRGTAPQVASSDHAIGPPTLRGL